jgi:hypothetical protein
MLGNIFTVESGKREMTQEAFRTLKQEIIPPPHFLIVNFKMAFLFQFWNSFQNEDKEHDAPR